MSFKPQRFVRMGHFDRLGHTGRVTFSAIVRELELPRQHVFELLRVLGPYLRADYRRTLPQRGKAGMTYDARVIDYLNEIRGNAHRSIEPPDSDWLAHYIERGTDGRQHPRPPTGGPGPTPAGRDSDRL